MGQERSSIIIIAVRLFPTTLPARDRPWDNVPQLNKEPTTVTLDVEQMFAFSQELLKLIYVNILLLGMIIGLTPTPQIITNNKIWITHFMKLDQRLVEFSKNNQDKNN